MGLKICEGGLLHRHVGNTFGNYVRGCEKRLLEIMYIIKSQLLSVCLSVARVG